MVNEEYIREFSGQILGIIKTDENGDQTAIDFPSRLVLGYYRKKTNYTTDFFGRVLGRGNSVVSLIYKEKEKQKRK